MDVEGNAGVGNSHVDEDLSVEGCIGFFLKGMMLR
jgi:hypothetical protein